MDGAVCLISDLVVHDGDEDEIDDEADGRHNGGEERDAERDEEPRARVVLESGRGQTPFPDEQRRREREKGEDAVWIAGDSAVRL